MTTYLSSLGVGVEVLAMLGMEYLLYTLESRLGSTMSAQRGSEISRVEEERKAGDYGELELRRHAAAKGRSEGTGWLLNIQLSSFQSWPLFNNGSGQSTIYEKQDKYANM